MATVLVAIRPQCMGTKKQSLCPFRTSTAPTSIPKYLGLVNYDELCRFSMIQPDRFCLVFALGATEVAPPACGQLQHFPFGVASFPPFGEERSPIESRDMCGFVFI
jgi:hypothetical protein